MTTHLDATPRRRWFRFTLRTLFVAVTVFCIWLGWQARIVHQRKAVRAMIASRPDYHRMGETYLNASSTVLGVEEFMNSMPMVRRWLGDEMVERIEVTAPLSEEDRHRIKAALLESEFVVIERTKTGVGMF